MILITGATGLLGSHLLYHISKIETKVRAIYRDKDKIELVKKVFSYYSNEPNNLLDKIEWVKSDVLDIPSLENAFRGIEKVYHCAGMVAFDRASETAMNKINIEGTANIVNICNSFSIKKLCHVSSIATLGKNIYGKEINEENYWNPNDDNSGYAISKNGGEMEVWRGIEEGLNAVIVNPSIIIGPGYWETSSGKLFSTIKNGLKYYTRGQSGFVGVNDVAEVMILLMNSDIKSNRFIVNSENLSYKNVFTTIAKRLNTKPPTIEIKKWILAIAWRIDKAKSLILGTKQNLSKDSARSALSIKSFNNEKIKSELKYNFRNINDVVTQTSKIYLTEI